MKTDKLITKKCTACGLTFRTDSNDINICGSCSNHNKKAKSKKKRKTRRASISSEIPLSSFMNMLEEYNNRHKTSYTYGKMTSLIDNGTIPISDFSKH